MKLAHGLEACIVAFVCLLAFEAEAQVGTITEFRTGITAGSVPDVIVAGPDGNLWFTEYAGNRIGKITPAGVITEYSVGISPSSAPWGIAPGPDGNMWFTESRGQRIGRITTGFVAPTPSSVPTLSGPTLLALVLVLLGYGVRHWRRGR